MGSLYDFKCEKCIFTTRCSHGRDRGFVRLVQPLYCTKCKILKNVHIGNYVRNEAEFTGYRVEDLKPVCGECGESQYLQLWDGMTCPNCRNVPMLMRDSWICWD